MSLSGALHSPTINTVWACNTFVMNVGEFSASLDYSHTHVSLFITMASQMSCYLFFPLFNVQIFSGVNKGDILLYNSCVAAWYIK